MIILDTNVVSELQGRKHSDYVVNWLRDYEIEILFLTTITIAEMRYGFELLEPGRRRSELSADLEAIQGEFLGRILGFSLQAAQQYSLIKAQRKKIGRPIDVQDAMIAAICLSHGAALATRNVKDFEGLDLRLINPFEGV